MRNWKSNTRREMKEFSSMASLWQASKAVGTSIEWKHAYKRYMGRFSSNKKDQIHYHISYWKNFIKNQIELSKDSRKLKNFITKRCKRKKISDNTIFCLIIMMKLLNNLLALKRHINSLGEKRKGSSFIVLKPLSTIRGS